MTLNSPDFAGQNYQDRRFLPDRVLRQPKLSPGVTGSAGPAGTKCYVLVMEGERGLRKDPTVHWIIYNIPADVSRLPRGIPTNPHAKDPAAALNGLQDSATGLKSGRLEDLVPLGALLADLREFDEADRIYYRALRDYQDVSRSPWHGFAFSYSRRSMRRARTRDTFDPGPHTGIEKPSNICHAT